MSDDSRPRRILRALTAAGIVAAVLGAGLLTTGLRGTGDMKDRQRLLLERPFPQALAPQRFRVMRVERIFDGKRTLGVAVALGGPDDEDAIDYYTQSMTADEAYDYRKKDDGIFGRTNIAVPGAGQHTFCAQGDDVFRKLHLVTCVATFNGLAIIAESANEKPGRGRLANALALLRAGVRHWRAIR